MERFLLRSAAVPVFVLTAGVVVALDVPFSEERQLPTTGHFCHQAADVDGDGDVDLFVARSLHWLENVSGDGTSWSDHVIPDVGFGVVDDLVAADFDLDDDLDLVAMNLHDFGEELDLYENTGEATWVWEGILGSRLYVTLRVGDLGGDGDPDVLVASPPGVIEWRENVSDGNGFSWQTIVVDSAAPGYYAAPDDVNGDGLVDVVANGGATDSVWYENDGASPPGWIERTIPASYSSGSVEPADIDGDGDTDVFIAGNEIDDSIYWHENNGRDPPGWTQRVVTAGGVDWPIDLYPVDLDGDGDTDLLSAGFYDDTVRWHENVNGDGLTWIDRIIGQNLKARRVSTADLDGDGDRDVIVSTFYGPERRLAWFANETPPSGEVPDGTGGDPLMLQFLPSGEVEMTWSPSCLPDPDYAVYQGVLGDFTSHGPLTCSTGGSETAVIEIGPDAEYYLVVARGSMSEGSYGRDSSGAERPPSAWPCIGQSREVCP